MRKRPYSAFIPIFHALMLAACAHTPQEELAIEPPQEPMPAKPAVAYKDFSTDTLYALLVAEMASDRQRYDIALGNYLQQARNTRDPNIVSHATKLAHMMRAQTDALQMAELWVEIEPDNAEARSILAGSLIFAKRLDEALEHATYLLDNGNAAAFESLAANAASGTPAQSATLAENYRELLLKHPKNTSLLVGYSLLLEQQNKLDEALEPIEQTLKLEPGNLKAAFQETRLLQLLDKPEAAAIKLEKLVNENPNNRGMRARYARLLVDTDTPKAREQYLILYEQFPFDKDVIFTLALVEKELELFDEAFTKFNTLLERKQYVPESNYQIGKMWLQQERPNEALSYFLNVTEGNNYVPAMSNVVKIFLDDNKNFEALELVRENRVKQVGRQREGLYMLESDILANTGQVNAAETALSSGLEEFPDSNPLLYARAMLYTRMEYLEAAEKDLKRILLETPDNAAALNALGYTLADKTQRLDEAQDYIVHALKLTPKDPAVLDSMGWLHYRKGEIQAALDYLRRAMEAMPDPEIAAHLGEVLWVNKDYEEARSIWKSGLELNPESKIIHQTIHRLNADLQ